ncbi:hypothetical protein C1W90_03550 [Burkholderia pseudomallei]|nr:hypothetical protein [Burkholderia pseudomallei]MBO7768482.1 hypothetical protein [Burkholderia pseudomallei]MBO7870806.1 hypothetical protein [Burkholderia pseudomallei]NAX98781.1 hypothetical protein [Burkholderia pseudomallei]NAY17413.1 hypothetical protein [Burkholderia pseudomallei]
MRRCVTLDVRCPMSDVRCPMSDVRCPMSDVRCPMSDVRCPMSDVRCPMSDADAAPSIEFPARVRRIGERLHFAFRIVARDRDRVRPSSFVV